MDKTTQQQQYPGYDARRQITITHLVSSKGAPIYVVEDNYNKGGIGEESKIESFTDRSIEDVIQEYFLTPSK